jgi:hypothetical protein
VLTPVFSFILAHLAPTEERTAPMKSPQPSVLTATTLFALCLARVAWADTVVQIPIDSLLDARPVSTVTDGVEVPWTAGQGIDGNGGGDGYVTKSVAAKHNYTGPALPDDGIFPAANGLPEFDLHFADANPATSFQAHNAHAGMAATIQFAVPQATYSNLHLVMTDSENADMLTVTLTYSDATTATVGPFTMPDYDQGLPANTKDVTYFSIFSGQKWGPMDTPGDNMGHSITGVTLTPSPTKPLTGVTINKPSDGHYLVFWGAVGIATGPVDAGASNVEDSGGGTDAMIAQSGSSTGTSGSVTSGTTSSAGAASGTTAESGSAGTGMATSGTVTSGAGGNGAGTETSGSTGAPAGSGGATGGASSQAGASASGSSDANSGGSKGCSVQGGAPSGKRASGLLLLLCAGTVLRRRGHAASAS